MLVAALLLAQAVASAHGLDHLADGVGEGCLTCHVAQQFDHFDHAPSPFSCLAGPPVGTLPTAERAAPALRPLLRPPERAPPGPSPLRF